MLPATPPVLARLTLVLLLACVYSPGCADPGKSTPPNYIPVLTIKARSPQTVDVRPLEHAKKDLADGARFVQQALADELANAGFVVSRSAAGPAPAGVNAVIAGTLSEYRTDIGMGGYRTRINVRFIVARGVVTRLDRQYAVDEGGSGLTGSSGEFETVTRNALTVLMRRAGPDVIAAIEQ